MASLKERRNFLQKQLINFAKETTDEKCKAGLEKFASNVHNFPRDLLEGCSDLVGFILDCQAQFEDVQDQTATQNTNNRLVIEELEGRIKAFEEDETKAFRRQMAINIEYELKFEFLQLCPDEIVNHLKHQGEFKFAEVAKLGINQARDMALPYAEECVAEVESRWYENLPGACGIRDGEQLFKETMRLMKRFTWEGADPTHLGGEGASLHEQLVAATELIEGMSVEGMRAFQDVQHTAQDIKEVARFCVEQLHRLRHNNGDDMLLFR